MAIFFRTVNIIPQLLCWVFTVSLEKHYEKRVKTQRNHKMRFPRDGFELLFYKEHILQHISLFPNIFEWGRVTPQFFQSGRVIRWKMSLNYKPCV